ncbi:LysM peptidoglycan-binding domain-containing protein [Massilia sp. YIM B02443]|uniref:LysM peptidoglycan-binding domain-containing protein n=1 Tax=Massilia sp. YIM B02443 TaxID=3050127 RepID=UPI0025B6E637|nr:LysM peptidoglycan-binding domain-containing protein [Massilia sp. YIM B02443]MDN4037690.1 LysM peptidoglycan-binding domain-containing protein [Massilia sp. YIM B02443]
MSNAIKTVNVERNDTLTGIATRNSVSLEALLAANPQIRSTDSLAIGQPVHIPLDQPPSQPVTPVPEAPQQSQQPDKQLDNAIRHEVLPGTCACGRDLTLDELAAIFPTRRRDQLDPFLAPMNRMMAVYGIDSCLRKAHALAQIGHESGSLRYRAEILPRGVTEQEAYAGYKGRGLIQITFKDKYQEYGRYNGMDFLGENRLKLETVEYATDSAGWFWNFGSPYRLNDYADKNDLILISTAINGGFNGFDDRAAIFRRAHKALRAAECKTAVNRSPDYLPFERSKAYDTRDMAFAWGLWSDPASSRHGLAKDPARAKAGYLRFLELNNSNPIARRRFGFKSTTAMIDHAREKSR